MPMRFVAVMIVMAVATAAQASDRGIVVAQGGAHSQPAPAPAKPLTPEQTMAARYPQPAKIGFLIGLPVLDWNDSTLGYVRQVARTRAGKIQLVVSYGGWAGGWLNWGARLVPVPIEAVQILGKQIGASEMPAEAFDRAPTWTAADGAVLAADDTIRIALGRR
jgi:hypothetical protein